MRASIVNASNIRFIVLIVGSRRWTWPPRRLFIFNWETTRPLRVRRTKAVRQKRSLAGKITLAAPPQKIVCGGGKPIKLASGLEGAIAQPFQSPERN